MADLTLKKLAILQKFVSQVEAMASSLYPVLATVDQMSADGLTFSNSDAVDQAVFADETLKHLDPADIAVAMATVAAFSDWLKAPVTELGGKTPKAVLAKMRRS